MQQGATLLLLLVGGSCIYHCSTVLVVSSDLMSIGAGSEPGSPFRTSSKGDIADDNQKASQGSGGTAGSGFN